MKKIFFCLLALLCIISCNNNLKDGDYKLYLLTTNDIHGHWFDSTYNNKGVRQSLFAVNYYVDSVRNKVGKNNVVLVDAGDCLQGDNAAYYYNYVDTNGTHLFSRLVDYMKYDAVAVGNHDVETGHPVYDKIAKELASRNIGFLAGNAFKEGTNQTYFPSYKIVNRAGLKILILGYTNPNNKAWLSESIWKGIDFKSLIPLVQNDVNKLVAQEQPNVVIVAIHSGVGNGDGSILESQGMDLYKSLKHVDFLVCAHDHKPLILQKDSIGLINSGSHARFVGEGILNLKVKDGKIVSKTIETKLIPVKAEKADPVMRSKFREDFIKVRNFTNLAIGKLEFNINTYNAFTGMCPYMDLLHSICLADNKADISFAAPLTFKGEIPQGILTYNELFTIYPFENQLYVIKMTGEQIKDYLEYSYDQWINTIPNKYALKIEAKKDDRYGTHKYSFVNRFYNFDSAGGLDYTVDLSKKFGNRVVIKSLANKTKFSLLKTYRVALTSYRFSGGGNLLTKGAGISHEMAEQLVIEKYPEIRNLLYDYIQKNKIITQTLIENPNIIGNWEFIPKKAKQQIDKDLQLVIQ